MVEVNLNIAEHGGKHLQHHPAHKSSHERTKDRVIQRRKEIKMSRKKTIILDKEESRAMSQMKFSGWNVTNDIQYWSEGRWVEKR